MKRLPFLLLLALPLQALPGELYHLRRLPPGQIDQTYTTLLLDACRHADTCWQDSSTDPTAGYWGSGRSDQMNEGIRAIAGMVLASGTLLKYDEQLSPPDRQTRLRQVTRAIRYAVSSHRTGPQTCTDGKPWGGSWQSAMWTATLTFGAWLIWDDLDPELRQGVERVVASEADRFLQSKPATGSSGDTKAEETGWNMVCLAVAANLLHAHPHAAAWHEKAIEFMMNTLSVPQDAHDQRLVDGRPVRDRFAGANLYPDFTLENHNMFHPSYMACSSYFLTQAAFYYTYAPQTTSPGAPTSSRLRPSAGIQGASGFSDTQSRLEVGAPVSAGADLGPIPEAADHHLLDTWAVFRTLVLPSGEVAYPQGMDWELHGLPYINLYASLACYQRDPLAARAEQHILQYMRAWQNMCRGDLAVPGSRLGFTRHAICAEQAAYAFLAHKVFGPPPALLSARKAATRLQGVWQRPHVGFIAHRTEAKFASVSWKNRCMGLLLPIGPGHDDNPFFSVPITTGLVGSLELNPRSDTTAKPLEHDWRQTPDGFETTGTLLLNGGRLKQTLRVTSLGKHTLAYQDRVIALTNLTLTRELGAPIGIENDELTGGKRVVHHSAGTATFEWRNPRQPFPVPGPWANVDGRLGVIMVAGSGLSYQQAPGCDPHSGVCTDILHASWSDRPREFQAGDTVARRIILFFVEITPAQTAKLSRSVSLDNHPTPPALRFKLPEGGRACIPLL